MPHHKNIKEKIKDTDSKQKKAIIKVQNNKKALNKAKLMRRLEVMKIHL